MTGWRADGRTAPTYWRTCPHELVLEGRCFTCRAVAIEGFTQIQHRDYSGLPIGSPLLQPPMSKAVEPMKGDGTSKARFNPSLK